MYAAPPRQVDVVKGDTLPGPGFTAALTATSETGGAGDSHRGAVATALVQAMGIEVGHFILHYIARAHPGTLLRLTT